MTWLYLGIVIGTLTILWSLLRGAPYVPSDKDAVASILKFLEAGKGKKVADLGSGDGRIVMALAQTGATAHGFEFNPLLVFTSRMLIRRTGLENKAIIYMKNFWNVDFSQYSGVSIFGAPHIMKKLEEKLLRELEPGARVASHVFKFPHWQPAARDEGGVYLYIKM